MQNHTWAVVLATGEGKCRPGLAADAHAIHAPRQFSPRFDGSSPFELALARARALVPGTQVCAVVDKQHERWWQSNTQAMQEGCLIVQPCNRGTGNSMLLALTHILKHDPQARLIFLPADQHVQSEDTLIQTLQFTLAAMPGRSDEIYLLGVAPDDADPELGYIIPQKSAQRDVQGVRRFIEKPSRVVAGKLIQEGGLWHSGIFAVDGSRLMELFKGRYPAHVAVIKSALDKMADPASPSRAFSHLYARISEIDFSHHVLQLHIADLRVVPVPPCGWRRLGSSVAINDQANRLDLPRIEPWGIQVCNRILRRMNATRGLIRSPFRKHSRNESQQADISI